MPAGMPSYVAKGPIFAALDGVLNVQASRTQMFNRITARTGNNWTEKFIDVFASMLGLSQPQKDHINEHWFGAGPNYYEDAWWPRALPVDIICRLGLAQAIRLANQANNLPMDTYWVCGVDDVQLVSVIGPGALTLLMFTPYAPAPDYLPALYTNQPEQIYTTRHKSMGPGEQPFSPDVEWVEFAQALRQKP